MVNIGECRYLSIVYVDIDRLTWVTFQRTKKLKGQLEYCEKQLAA